jgi:hypothetical protein
MVATEVRGRTPERGSHGQEAPRLRSLELARDGSGQARCYGLAALRPPPALRKRVGMHDAIPPSTFARAEARGYGGQARAGAGRGSGGGLPVERRVWRGGLARTAVGAWGERLLRLRAM